MQDAGANASPQLRQARQQAETLLFTLQVRCPPRSAAWTMPFIACAPCQMMRLSLRLGSHMLSCICDCCRFKVDCISHPICFGPAGQIRCPDLSLMRNC